MKGYKIFSPDWKCRDMQYRVGETVRVDGPLVMCAHGLHFCQQAKFCSNYYLIKPENKYAEVRADGVTETSRDKSVTDVLTVVREISYEEFRKLSVYEFAGWHANGVQMFSNMYIGDDLDGPSKAWYGTGNIRSVTNFKNGKRDGVAIRWHPNGVKMLESMYVGGRLNGTYTTWDDHGFKRSESIYLMDDELSRKYFDDFGEPL